MVQGAIETPLGEMWMKGGVLYHRIDSVVVEPEAAAQVYAAVQQLTGGEIVPSVIDIRNVAFAEHEARAMFARSPEESLESATALVVGPRASRTMGRVFMVIDKPARPVEIFTSMEEATAWARQFLAT